MSQHAAILPNEEPQQRVALTRKFNCWNISSVQQYGRLKESRIRSAVFGK